MNIVRLGHYYIPATDDCQWATVIKVVEQAPVTSTINVKVIDGEGNESVQTVKEFTNPQRTDPDPTFHLSTMCPWGR